MNPSTSLSGKDYLCALAVVLIWGSNFVVMKLGLQGLSPMMLGTLRYICASLVFIPFVRRSTVPWRWLLVCGMLAFGQFVFLFVGLKVGMTAGIASLVMQTQAFFTIVLAAVLLQERPRVYQWVGVAISAIGLVLIASVHGDAPGQMTLIGFLLALTGALSWAGANIGIRYAMRASPGFDPLAFIVYSSAVPILPFFALALLVDGWSAITDMMWNISGREIFAVVYLGVLATVVAYTLWTRLLVRHPAARVVPFSLLVPVVGIYAASLVFDEHMQGWQWAGAALVFSGLLFNQFGGRVIRR
ncbi:EamA family transporter [Pigmentiphaga aceris]|uniref:EamA family transporter n=1 Tax=Pigmentiphaga aceris TaxID=1940612 RepID=UPI001FE3A6D7|nr:EamA family transporter [Pigmentiphaga aceris]